MKADGCDMVLLGTVIRETIGAMGEAKKLGWDVTFLGATPSTLEVPALGKEAVEGLYAAAAFEIPYEDTAKGKVKDWLANYKKMFGPTPTPRPSSANAVMTFAHYANKAGKDSTGQKMLDALSRATVHGHLQLAAPSSRRPTISPARSPRSSRSRRAAGCW
jgi:ABC-type branched-subunit amino acid transport system substrate-binding protein